MDTKPFLLHTCLTSKVLSYTKIYCVRTHFFLKSFENPYSTITSATITFWVAVFTTHPLISCISRVFLDHPKKDILYLILSSIKFNGLGVHENNYIQITFNLCAQLQNLKTCSTSLVFIHQVSHINFPYFSSQLCI